MKCKTTAKAIRAKYGSRILSIGYCAAQYLLRYETPFAYSAGVYGWNCDYYDIDGVCISTGYRPVGKSVDYATLESYESTANTVIRMFDSWEGSLERQKEIRKHLNAFIKSALDA